MQLKLSHFFNRRTSNKRDLELFVTLWPSFPHFNTYVEDNRLTGIRLNSAMISCAEVISEMDKAKGSVPVYFDAKGRQMRIESVSLNSDHLDITLNHPIKVRTPTEVVFKGGEDSAVLHHLEEDGKRLIFSGGPRYMVKPGESLYIRDKSLHVDDNNLFTLAEIQKIELVRARGINKYFLSYVESQRDIDRFLELTGKDAEIQLKIESIKGLQFVANEFKKKDNLMLVAARGDLYVEVLRPHDILSAMKLIISKDNEACAASRLLLSVVAGSVPSCSDFSELAWLYDIGYRRMMLCDEICLKDELLSTAIRAFDEFRKTYAT